ncbi:SGNH/GDSL hydrolase family protein [Planctomicrobium piriforme]|nr:SGNH/GDSL hydrolase family protein [Planctomicrobium piriforme]
MSANRRDFIKSSLVAGVGLSAGLAAKPAAAAEPVHGLVKPGDVILFQGDSITDAGRSRETAGTPNIKSTLGNGYAWIAGSHLLVDAPPGTLNVFNRGISGNKVHQLAARWDVDCLELKPNVLSILIGVNDIWHKLNGKYDGTVETYEKDYRALLQRTKETLPDVKLVICEPFVLRCGAVNDSWFPEFDKFRAAAKSVAEDFHAVFVPFQAAFDRAVAYAEPKNWAGDGVHPSADGAALMAHEWIMAVGHSHA